MSENPIRLIVPTSRAWARMKRILFEPLDIGKWFILGFTAWLATLFEGGGSTGGGGGNYDAGDGEGGMEDFSWESIKTAAGEWIDKALTWIQDNPEIVMVIGGILIFVFLLLFVLYWVSCRGKFMFLDNVVRDRALVVQPWKEYGRQGNSLFLWTTVFGIFSSLILLAILGGGACYAFDVLDNGDWGMENTYAAVGIGIGFFCAVVLFGYIGMLINQFIIPLMYRYRLSTTEAWIRFLPLHTRRWFRFLLYAIWNALLVFGALLAIVAIGFGTCCIGFILMAIPYIGAVFLLPITVFFRSLGPEYLAQFGEEWDILESPPGP